MSAAGIGAGVGAGVSTLSSIIGLRAQNKAVISQIEREGHNLATSMKMVNTNIEQLDRELGDILSKNALDTAKNMATAKVMMSGSGTVGGTTAQVSKQAYIDKILADADVIEQAENQEIALLNQQLSARINYRQQADAMRSQIKSPMEAMIGTLSSAISGASAGASIGESFSAINKPAGITSSPDRSAHPMGGLKSEYDRRPHVTSRANW